MECEPMRALSVLRARGKSAKHAPIHKRCRLWHKFASHASHAAHARLPPPLQAEVRVLQGNVRSMRQECTERWVGGACMRMGSMEWHMQGVVCMPMCGGRLDRLGVLDRLGGMIACIECVFGAPVHAS